MEPCTKHKPPSKGKADAHLRNLKTRTPDYKGESYYCAACAAWHVGRPKQKAHKNKYKDY